MCVCVSVCVCVCVCAQILRTYKSIVCVPIFTVAVHTRYPIEYTVCICIHTRCPSNMLLQGITLLCQISI